MLLAWFKAISMGYQLERQAGKLSWLQADDLGDGMGLPCGTYDWARQKPSTVGSRV
jgi:hypothetical protein